jgi:hypothetical protein
MNKANIYMLFLFFFLIHNSGKAQLNIGISVSPLFVNGTYRENTGTESMPKIVKKDINHIFYNVQLHFGYDFPIFKFNEDNMSLGTSFRVASGYFMADQLFEDQFSLDLPQYITYRYGRRSSTSNEKKWGIGMGIGYHFRLVPLPVAIPGAFIDCTFYKNLFLSVNFDVLKSDYYSNFSSEGIVPTFSSRQLGFLLGYSF